MQNGAGGEPHENKADDGQCDGDIDTLQMECQPGEDPPAEEIVDPLHDGGPDQQDGLGDAQPELKQPPPEQKESDQRQGTRNGEEHSHVEGRLNGLAADLAERKGAEPELPGIACEPSQRHEERDGHERRDDEQIKGLNTLYQ